MRENPSTFSNSFLYVALLDFIDTEVSWYTSDRFVHKETINSCFVLLSGFVDLRSY